MQRDHDVQSGFLLLFGKHSINTSSTVQGPHGLSSDESEFYACVKEGAALLGNRRLMEEERLDLSLTLRLRTDSSGAKGCAI